jgi:ABC-type transport system involved in cytochrome c biogenesis permease subunit
MTARSAPGPFRTTALAASTGAAFALYLFVADMAIPAPPHAHGHYNVGNALVGALFFSYAPFTAALSPLVAMAMYGTYAYMALARRRCAGLALLALHYGVAALVTVPFYLHRSPDLIADTRDQFIRLAAQPGTALFVFAPFVIANVWYVLRMRPGRRRRLAPSAE